MAAIVNVSHRKVLIVEEMPEMRTQLQNAANGVGLQRIHAVNSVKDALSKIESNIYDLILCEYTFRDGANGQQFLEYLRHSDLLPRNSVFIIITAENNYEQIVTAAECMPDSYLLKPFKSMEFMGRLNRLLEKQSILEKVDQAHDAKNWQKVVLECDALIGKKSSYLIDLYKIKAASLMKLDKPAEALDVYKEALKYKDLPWAQLGLARANAAMNNLDVAEEICQTLIKNYPKFIATYDFLSEVLIKENKPKEAQEILENAAMISPINLGRTRQLSSVAMTNGNFELAEEAISKVLKKHKHSPVTSAHDYALLSRAMIEQNRADQALELLKSINSDFDDPHSEIVLAASESIAHRKAGNHDEADAALQRAMPEDHTHLPAHVTSTLAEACYAAGKEDQGTNLLKHLLQNNPNDLKLECRVKMAFAMSGKSMSESTEMILQSEREIIKLNNEGVRKAQSGAYKEAVDLLVAAADRLPNNLLIASNAAFILAAALAEHKYDEDDMRKCLQYRQRIFDKDPHHPKLARIDSMLRKAKEAA